jgi:hypothetical protein
MTNVVGIDGKPIAPRKRRLPPSRKGAVATDKQRAVGAANLQRINRNKKRTAEAHAKGESRFDKVLDGRIKVHQLDDEEIARGMIRDDAGTWAGNQKRVIPNKIAQAMVRELYKRAARMMQSVLPRSIEIAHEIMENGKKDADRLRAVELFQDRTLGRVPQHVAVHTDAAWEDTFEGVVWSEDAADSEGATG